MLQQPNQDASSPLLLLDFVSKFLTNVLEKDRNYNYYLKQWDSFRLLLSAVPLDINPVLSYINGLRSTGSTSSQPAKNFNRPRPIIVGDNLSRGGEDSFHLLSQDEINNSFRLADTPTSGDGHKRAFSNYPSSYTSSPKFPEPDQNKFQSKRPSTFQVSANNNASNDSADFGMKRAQGIAQIGNILGEIGKDSPMTYGKPVDSPGYKMVKNEGMPSISVSVRAPLTFLTEKAKRLRDNIEIHSEMVLKGRPQNQTNPMMEARSPLRAVKFYEKKANPMNPPNNGGSFSNNNAVPVTNNGIPMPTNGITLSNKGLPSPVPKLLPITQQYIPTGYRRPNPY